MLLLGAMMLGVMKKKLNTYETSAAVVATLAQARYAVAVAARLERPLLLITAPGAQASHGPGYLLEMMRQAGAARAVIDCGGDAGTAMLALRLGWRELHLSGHDDTVARVAAMTTALGGVFHAVLPAALDLSGPGPVDEPLAAWLAGDGSN